MPPLLFVLIAASPSASASRQFQVDETLYTNPKLPKCLSGSDIITLEDHLIGTESYFVIELIRRKTKHIGLEFLPYNRLLDL